MQHGLALLHQRELWLRVLLGFLRSNITIPDPGTSRVEGVLQPSRVMLSAWPCCLKTNSSTCYLGFLRPKITSTDPGAGRAVEESHLVSMRVHMSSVDHEGVEFTPAYRAVEPSCGGV
jgi:hypothetical protein